MLEAPLPLHWHYGGDLVPLSSDITGDSSVNCHNTGEEGKQLQQLMVHKSFTAAKVRRKGKVTTLTAVTGSIVMTTGNPKPDGMICFLEGSADLSSVLMYELTSSIFLTKNFRYTVNRV